MNDAPRLNIWSIAHATVTAAILCFVATDSASRRGDAEISTQRHAELMDKTTRTEHLVHHCIFRLDVLQHARAGEKPPPLPPVPLPK
jgi:hypothetical protein